MAINPKSKIQNLKSHLPETAFIHPDEQNREAIATLLTQVVELLIEIMTTAADRSPLPEPLDLKGWAQLSDTSIGSAQLLQWVRSQLHHSMNAAHPGYIGHMDSIPTTMSVIGDLLVAAVNNNMLSVEMSPVFSRLEPLVLKQIAAEFGLGPAANGVLVSGGSLANLQALTVARNVAFDALKTGIAGLAHKPVFFVSEVAHTSMKKAAMLLGLGTEAAIPIATNADSQMKVSDLQAKIEQARQQGQQPFAVVATAGTTVTGNVDPLRAIAAVAKAQNLWFHVDAAYGGAVIFSPEHRPLLAGIEQADSVTFNPQKWLYVTKTCAMVLFRNFDLLNQQFRILAPYMNDHDEWPNLGELTVQGTRHPDILKLWLSLQHIGKQGYATIIHHNFALTERFTVEVNKRAFLTLASQPQMNLICFRGTPDWLLEAAWDQWNQSLQTHLLKQGHTFLSLPLYRGQRWLKAVLLNPFTTTEDIRLLFEQIDRFI
ncbi:MAG: aminotransferase class I/II-fold pyridoxal phosphate-dependent enzyme [Cyanobacteria bacterium P01_D01_bin.44]